LKTKQIEVAKHYGLHKSRVCEIARDKPQVYKEMEAKTKAGFDLEYGKQLGELAGLVYLYCLQSSNKAVCVLSIIPNGFALTVDKLLMSSAQYEITEAINFMRSKCYGVSSID